MDILAAMEKSFPNAMRLLAGGGTHGGLVFWGDEVFVVTEESGDIMAGKYSKHDWVDGGDPEPIELCEAKTIDEAMVILNKWADKAEEQWLEAKLSRGWFDRLLSVFGR